MKLLKALTLVGLAIALASCGSSSKKSSLSNDEYPADNVEEQGLVLNGDSDSGRAGSVRTVYFAYDSSQLGSEAKSTLDGNAEFLKSNAGVEIQIEGHCDERGGIEYNLALGQRRAQTVKNYLTALGVKGSRVSIVSYGKERPIEFGHDERAWSRNRRANFVVTAK